MVIIHYVHCIYTWSRLDSKLLLINYEHRVSHIIFVNGQRYTFKFHSENCEKLMVYSIIKRIINNYIVDYNYVRGDVTVFFLFLN